MAKETGAKLAGIRLDSGDLAHLSIEARRMLDDAGLSDTRIVASNDLDERLITDILDQGAKIDAWGVGTKLVTCFDQPALGGVYKLGAYRDASGAWRDAIKLSEQPVKISNPGILQVRRLYRGARDGRRRDLRQRARSRPSVRFTTSRTAARPATAPDVRHRRATCS